MYHQHKAVQYFSIVCICHLYISGIAEDPVLNPVGFQRICVGKLTFDLE